MTGQHSGWQARELRVNSEAPEQVLLVPTRFFSTESLVRLVGMWPTSSRMGDSDVPSTEETVASMSAENLEIHTRRELADARWSDCRHISAPLAHPSGTACTVKARNLINSG